MPQRLRAGPGGRPARPRRRFVLTAGAGLRGRAEAAKQRGEFFLRHGLLAVARPRTMHGRFTTRYRGKRRCIPGCCTMPAVCWICEVSTECESECWW